VCFWWLYYKNNVISSGHMNIIFRSSCDVVLREYTRNLIARRRDETREQQLVNLKAQMRRDRRSLCRRIAVLEQACSDVRGVDARLKLLGDEVRERLDSVEARILTSEQMCSERKFTAAIASDFARLVENYTELRSGGMAKDGNWSEEVSWTRI
jgi:hypothetical protein